MALIAATTIACDGVGARYFGRFGKTWATSAVAYPTWMSTASGVDPKSRSVARLGPVIEGQSRPPSERDMINIEIACHATAVAIAGAAFFAEWLHR